MDPVGAYTRGNVGGAKSIANALTIDVEEHFQVHNLARHFDRETWDLQPSRVVRNTRLLLRILAEYDVRATFFVLGWVAERHPALVKELAAAGHEVATHGYGHALIYDQTPTEFDEDIRRAVASIEAAGLPRPIGYRAPGFSITARSLWAPDILLGHGLRYDSSIFPTVAHDRYGMRGAERFAHRLPCGLLELPPSTVRMGRQNWPVAGGGYFRLYPLWVTKAALRRINAEGQPAVFYVHPWEFDPDQPRVRGVSLLKRFRHYQNLDKTERRLRALLTEFRFAPMREVFAERIASAPAEAAVGMTA
ncbi:MAG TPA: XrtA system polysaccharide deacetylase [Vicinamibacteria bacterium]|nr:XrtA system polysaccharide deacetylase [Vicinamibacteria bacterium]